LDALDPEDRWTYERHLDTCERCREDVARLREGAAELAYATAGPEPRPELRDRILRAAHEDRPARVIPFRRWLFPMTAVAAAAAAVAAIGLGLWANSLRDVGESRVVALEGSPGRLIVDDGRATLVLCLDRAPAGKTYEAWVLKQGEQPYPAGLFPGGCASVDVAEPVAEGNVVAVTLERAGGVRIPTGDILVTARV
jgi:anti-sigma-K factor RskA